MSGLSGVSLVMRLHESEPRVLQVAQPGVTAWPVAGVWSGQSQLSVPAPPPS